MKALVLIPSMLIGLTAFCQVKLRIPYNSMGEITLAEKAFFYREVMLDTVNLRFTGPFRDTNLSGELLREGHYEDGEKRGQFTFYHPGGGKVESSGHFDQDRRSGIWNFYNENGARVQQVNFLADDFQVLMYINSKGEKTLVNGTGDWELFVGSGGNRVALSARFFRGKRSGKWNYGYTSGKKILTESYKNGEFSQGVLYDERGKTTYHESKITPEIFDPPELKTMESFKTDKYFYGPDAIAYLLEVPDPFERVPAARQAGIDGGLAALYAFISGNIQYPRSSLGLHSQVVIEVLIDRTDRPVNFRVIKGVGQELNAESIRLLSAFGGWLSPLVNGKKEPGRKVVPITFKPGNNGEK